MYTLQLPTGRQAEQRLQPVQTLREGQGKGLTLRQTFWRFRCELGVVSKVRESSVEEGRGKKEEVSVKRMKNRRC